MKGMNARLFFLEDEIFDIAIDKFIERQRYRFREDFFDLLDELGYWD